MNAGQSPRPARQAILIGPPGSGKTSVGAALAALWGCRLRDTDADIEASEGKAIADIFIDDGEPHFRQLERVAVLRALSDVSESAGPAVVALGGGAPMDEAVGAALAGAPVVFLDVSLAHAAPRVGLSTARPLLAINPRATWQRLYAQRRATYEGLARITVLTDDLTPAEIAAEIDQRLADRETEGGTA